MTPERPNGWYNTPGAATPGECARACPPVIVEVGNKETDFVGIKRIIDEVKARGETIIPTEVKPGDLVMFDTVIKNDEGTTRVIVIGEVDHLGQSGIGRWLSVKLPGSE